MMMNTILQTKITAAQNELEVTLSYHSARGLYFLGVGGTYFCGDYIIEFAYFLKFTLKVKLYACGLAFF